MITEERLIGIFPRIDLNPKSEGVMALIFSREIEVDFLAFSSPEIKHIWITGYITPQGQYRLPGIHIGRLTAQVFEGEYTAAPCLYRDRIQVFVYPKSVSLGDRELRTEVSPLSESEVIQMQTLFLLPHKLYHKGDILGLILRNEADEFLPVSVTVNGRSPIYTMSDDIHRDILKEAFP